MDGRNFDDLARKLATGVSRRTVLRGLIGGGAALGGLRGARAMAASKVTICHFPPGNPGNLQLIEVGSGAVSEHLAHGDTVYGGCCVDADCPAMSGDCGVLAGCQADGSGTSSCVYADESAICDDGDACNGAESCQQTFCVPGEPMDCTGFGDQCNVGVCRGGECGSEPLGAETGCTSGNACTIGDYCSEGDCIPGNPIPCEAPGECWTIGECDPDSGCPAPVQKTPGAACGRPASCDGGSAFSGDYCDELGFCAPGRTRACSAGQECVSGQCESTCKEMQEACDPDANECCNGLCRDVTRCGDGPQCCVTGATPCFGSCDCCDPYSCVGGICCGNLLNLPCDEEQSPCCAGYQCLGGTCQLNECPHTGEICTLDNNECCQDEPTECHTRSCDGTSVALPRCCHPSGGSCNVGCDCCPGLECTSRGVCEAPVPPPTCGETAYLCVNGACCGDNVDCVITSTSSEGFPGVCAGHEGAACRAVGMVQVGFPGWVSSDRGIDCNIFGGYTCGPDLVCTACSTAGNSCLCADPDDLYTCTCCYGLACIDGVCTG